MLEHKIFRFAIYCMGINTFVQMYMVMSNHDNRTRLEKIMDLEKGDENIIIF